MSSMVLSSYLTKPIVDVINVVSITALATVNQWDEQNEEETQSALYWRQAIDVRTMELSVSSKPQACNEHPANHLDYSLWNLDAVAISPRTPTRL
jgi:hypothetical protein